VGESWVDLGLERGDGPRKRGGGKRGTGWGERVCCIKGGEPYFFFVKNV